MSRSTPEGRIVGKLLDYCATLPRCVARKVHGSVYGTAGEPDLDIVLDGRAVRIEVKVPGTEHAITRAVTDLQRARLREYARAGALVGVVTSVEELRAVLPHRSAECDYPGGIVAHENMEDTIRRRWDVDGDGGRGGDASSARPGVLPQDQVHDAR